MKRVLLSLWLVAACTSEHTITVDERASPIEVSIDVFSGRPNPAFILAASEMSALQRTLDKLPGTNQQARETTLGYRGFLLQQAGTTIRIGGGVIVVQKGKNQRVGLQSPIFYQNLGFVRY